MCVGGCNGPETTEVGWCWWDWRWERTGTWGVYPTSTVEGAALRGDLALLLFPCRLVICVSTLRSGLCRFAQCKERAVPGER